LGLGKGHNTRLSSRLAAAIADHCAGTDRRLTLCSRSWELLEPLAAALPDARIVHSVGSRRQLEALRRRLTGRRLAGVSIHRKLLGPVVAAELRARADLVMTWPVETPSQAWTLAGWGIDGVISESFESLSRALRPPVAA
jgi:glycerophosphoryl diester phosphodiesterase